MTAQKFLILASDHPNNAVLSVGQWMAGGLKALGIDVRVLSIPRDVSELSGLLRDDIAGVISLGPMPLDIKVDQRWYLWQKLQCPVWLYMLDAIIYDYHRVPVMREFLKDAFNHEQLTIVSPERGYFELLGKRSEGGCLPDGLKHIPFGHFANLSPTNLPKEQRLCVIGTIGGELGLRPDIDALQETVSLYGKNILGSQDQLNLVELLTSQDVPDMPLRLLVELLDWRGEQVFSGENLPLICAIDSYYKRLRRFIAIRSLSGLPIDFYGAGWSEYFPDETNFRFLGNIKHQEVAQYSARYKAVVNFDPNWEMGIHDRVFTTCAMGTPVITNRNAALQAANLPSELVHTYSANNPQLQAIAEPLLASREETGSPHLQVLTEQSWVNRMARLITHTTEGAS
jgi:hypothetical protein